MLHRHTDLVRDRVAEFHGAVIKTIGDSVMAEFPEPVFAVQAAVQIQRHLRLLNDGRVSHLQISLEVLRARLQREAPHLAIPVERPSGILQMRAAVQFAVERLFGGECSRIELTSLSGRLQWKRLIQGASFQKRLTVICSGQPGTLTNWSWTARFRSKRAETLLIKFDEFD